MSNQNPYSMATNAYASSATATTSDGRSLESSVLLKSAQKMETLAKRLDNGEKVSLEEIGDTLDNNQKIWQIFLSDMMNPEHPLPLEIKNNIANLALYVFKRTQEVLIDTVPEKFTVLININRNIASGLSKRPAIAKDEHKTPLPQKALIGADSCV